MTDDTVDAENIVPVARVLIAEDSLVIRRLLRRQLEEHGYEVIEAVDGEDALRGVTEHEPDVVLLDVEMPKLNGHGVLTAMQLDKNLAAIPVVFITARATTEDVVEGLRLGAHDYLRKPFEPAELVARVSAAARVKRLQDALRRTNLELEAVSRTDVLTGLPNRRHLIEHLSLESGVARRHDIPFSLLIVDVDHFKKINDRFGHDTGDRVLEAIAHRMADAMRAEDMIGRWGGEEFLVIAPATGFDDAASLGERIRACVADGSIAAGDGTRIMVTVSVGCASGVTTTDAMLHQADAALYDAKEGGRNRVVSVEVVGHDDDPAAHRSVS